MKITRSRAAIHYVLSLVFFVTQLLFGGPFFNLPDEAHALQSSQHNSYFPPHSNDTGPRLSLPPVSGQDSGHLPGEFKVTERGTAAYQIPIPVPSGIAGMKPGLALSYDSRVGNGRLGMGWSLSGLSQISRCSATIAQDGVVDRVDFDELDRFCLDGQRLVRTSSGDYGTPGEYRTENDSFSQIIMEAPGISNNWLGGFQVRTKDGLRMTYGHTEDSIEQGFPSNQILSWHLTKITDSQTNDNGNTIFFDYYEDYASGIHRISQIRYTENLGQGISAPYSLVFVYEERPDHIYRHKGGAKRLILNRLSEIQFLHQGDLIRQYLITYTQSATTNRSFITSISQCSQGKCINPTTFDWITVQNKLEFAALNSPGGAIAWSGINWDPNFRPHGIADLTGDGIADALSFQSDGLWVFESTGNGFLPPVNWSPINWSPASRPHGIADLTGDGITDVFSFQTDGIYVWESTGSGFLGPSRWSDLNWAPSSRPHGIGDLTGDGIADIFSFQTDGIYVWASTGNGFLGPDRWSTINWSPSFRPHGVADLTGDGVTDIFSLQTDGLWVWESNGTGFEPVSRWSTANWHPSFRSYELADVTGDGIIDFLTFQTDGLWVWESNASGTLTVNNWSPINWHPASRPHGVADLTGDGLSDVFSFQTDGLYVWDSRRSAFNGPTRWSSENWHPSVRAHGLADFTGDGKIDLASFQSDALWVWPVSKGRSDILAKITNGHGKEIDIEYRALTDKSIYQKANDAVHPVVDVQTSIDVVTAFETSNGIGGKNRIEYQYSGLQFALDGRGFCGFRTISVRDLVSGIRTELKYSQQFPFKSLLESQSVYSEANVEISSAATTWAVKYLNGGANYFVYPSAQYEEARTLTGSFIKSTSTDSVYDDFGNVTQVTVSDSAGNNTQTINTFQNNTNYPKWHLGRLERSQVTKQSLANLAITRVSEFEYDSDTGRLIKEIIEPDHPSLRLEKYYQRDSFGNIDLSTIRGGSINERTSETIYDSSGRFVVEEVNALGHSQSRTIDYASGLELSVTGPNGLTSYQSYDFLNRKYVFTTPIGTEERNSYFLASSAAPASAVHYIRKDRTGLAPEIIYFDLLDREVRREKRGFDGRRIFVDKEYNSKGELQRKSDPYFEGDPIYWTEYLYDQKGRVVEVRQPGNRITTHIFDGLQTTTTNPLGQIEVKTYNELEQLVAVKDHLGNETSYTYDSYGNLLQISDAAGNITSLKYDVRGNRIEIDDPDAGVTTFSYNELGELISRTDSKAQVETNQYDLLGRLISRIENEGSSFWVYDTAPNGIGLLASTQSDSFVESYTYDSFSRLLTTQTGIDQESYSITKSYDALGRVQSLSYPTGYAINYVYDTDGFLIEIRQSSDDALIWQLGQLDAKGQLTSEYLGNGIASNRVFDQVTGYLNSIRTGNCPGYLDLSLGSCPANIQDLQFQFDQVGNLLSRSDINRNLQEDFTYDHLNRLTSTQVLGGYGTQISYDAIGNITYRSDVGAYTYAMTDSGPHAVSEIVGPKANSFAYDSNGNRIEGLGEAVSYTSFDKPAVISKNGISLTFSYGPDRHRYKQLLENGSQTLTKHYVGKYFEREEAGSNVTDKHFIFNGDKAIAIYTEELNGSTSFHYLHRDHLNSLQAITDDLGQFVEVLSFDAWGLRRNAYTWDAPTGVIMSSIDRGFTGHEHLGSVGLIHMNGRVYDPELGRFLSPDPHIQAPDNPQSLNRYSYVINNPLSYNDPSGFFFKKIFRAIGRVFSNPVINTVVSIALLASPVPHASLWLAGIQSTTSIANGGGIFDVAKNFAISFASAQAFGVVGDSFAGKGGAFLSSAHIQKSFVHGLVGGARSLVNGGKFQHGFFGDFATQGFASRITSSLPGAGLRAPRIIIAAIVGGTVSELSGGNFGNGAVTAAYARLYNDEAHMIAENEELIKEYRNNMLRWMEAKKHLEENLEYHLDVAIASSPASALLDNYHSFVGDEILKGSDVRPRPKLANYANRHQLKLRGVNQKFLRGTGIMSTAIVFSGAINSAATFSFIQLAENRISYYEQKINERLKWNEELAGRSP